MFDMTTPLSKDKTWTIFRAFVDVVQSIFVNGLSVQPNFAFQSFYDVKGVTEHKIFQTSP